jgi:hypothetical protein
MRTMLSLRNKLTVEASRAGAKRGTAIAAWGICLGTFEAMLPTPGTAISRDPGTIENGSRERPLLPPPAKHSRAGSGWLSGLTAVPNGPLSHDISNESQYRPPG